MSVLVWVLIGIALWHFTVLLPDRFHGGIIGAFLYAVGGAPARIQAGHVAAARRGWGAEPMATRTSGT